MCRSIALSVFCVAASKEHRLRQNERRLVVGPDLHNTDLVFERGDDSVLHPDVSGSAFRRAVA